MRRFRKTRMKAHILKSEPKRRRCFARRLFQRIACAASVFCLFLMGIGIYTAKSLPDNFHVLKDETLEIEDTLLSVKRLEDSTVTASKSENKIYQAQLSVFHIIPVKTVTVKEVEMEKVVAVGSPFGIKMLANGAIVVGISEIETVQGFESPAEKAGLQIGDIIQEANGQRIICNADISKVIEESQGKEISLMIERAGEMFHTVLQPVKAAFDNCFKGGIWVRDSTAGIGTVTFYDVETKRFGGLGHGVCDTDTKELMPLRSGDIVDVTLTGCVRGSSGNAGALQGYFSSPDAIGRLTQNVETGVYGNLFKAPVSSGEIEIVLKQEVKKGEAFILTTIDSGEPRYYSVQITDVNYNEKQKTKNMMVRITDPALIEATGGIVQGMSGSPIIQDGKLVGAVTHVFVNDPTRGYGIFIENMLETAQSAAEQQIKEAS